MSNPIPVFWRERWPTAVVCIGVAVAVLPVRLAHAQAPLEIELTYEVEASLPDCPAESAFRTMVVDQLGYDPLRSTSPHRVLAQARGNAGTIVGVVRWQHSESAVGGERELRARTCKELAHAMAFAVAVQVQLLVLQKETSKGDVTSGPNDIAEKELVLLQGVAESPSTAAAPPPSSRPNDLAGRAPIEPMDVRSDADAGGETSGWQSALGVGVAARLRREPTTSVEGRAFGGLYHGLWGGELSLGGTWPQQLSTLDDKGFRLWSVWGSVFGCAVPKPIVACMGARVERLSARGTGVDVSRLAHAWVVELGPRVAIAGDLTPNLRTALYLEARGLLAPAWVEINDTRAWTTPSWSLTAGVDVAAIWQSSTSGEAEAKPRSQRAAVSD